MKTFITIALSCIIFAASAATITVKPAAEVNSQIIKLSDVAEYACSDIEKPVFDKVTVGMINDAGGQKIITLGKIKISLAQYGIDYNKQDYLGADKVTVTRTDADATVTDVLTKAAQEWLLNRLKTEVTDVELSLTSSPNISFAPSGEWTVQFTETGNSNTRIVQATVIKAGVTNWKGSYTFSIHRFAMVYTAGKTISRGCEISIADLIMARKEITNVSSAPLTIGHLIGLRASSTINTDEIITTTNTEKTPVVKRNSKVSVKAYCGVMVISMIATACEDGSIGQIIRVENPDNHQQYYARVKSPSELEIVR